MSLSLSGLDVEVVATPGHTRDHVAYRLASGVLLTGDHVLGRGTSVVAYPDGDLAAYLASLRRVLDLGPDALYPGHGPELTVDPAAVVRYYLDHRRFREQQILIALQEGPAAPATLVATIYREVDRRLGRRPRHPFVQRSRYSSRLGGCGSTATSGSASSNEPGQRGRRSRSSARRPVGRTTRQAVVRRVRRMPAALSAAAGTPASRHAV
jgi:hypothetical protein